jgi:hypothetical protein
MLVGRLADLFNSTHLLPGLHPLRRVSETCLRIRVGSYFAGADRCAERKKYRPGILLMLSWRWTAPAMRPVNFTMVSRN